MTFIYKEEQLNVPMALKNLGRPLPAQYLLRHIILTMQELPIIPIKSVVFLCNGYELFISDELDDDVIG